MKQTTMTALELAAFKLGLERAAYIADRNTFGPYNHASEYVAGKIRAAAKRVKVGG